MSNATAPLNPIQQAMTDFFLHNVTRIGVVGGFGFFTIQVVIAAIQRNWISALNELGYLFLLLIPAGAAFRAKRVTDMLVTTAAEANIDRASMATAISMAHSESAAVFSATSKDPAVMREINKINGDRKTVPSN